MRICLVYLLFQWFPSSDRIIVELLASGCEVVDPIRIMELVMATVKLCLAFSPVVCLSLSWLVHLLPCKLPKIVRRKGNISRNSLSLRMYRGRASICRGLRVVAFCAVIMSPNIDFFPRYRALQSEQLNNSSPGTGRLVHAPNSTVSHHSIDEVFHSCFRLWALGVQFSLSLLFHPCLGYPGEGPLGLMSINITSLVKNLSFVVGISDFCPSPVHVVALQETRVPP